MRYFFFTAVFTFSSSLAFAQALSLKQAVNKSAKDRVQAAATFHNQHIEKSNDDDLVAQQFLKSMGAASTARSVANESKSEKLDLQEADQSEELEFLNELNEGTEPAENSGELDL